MPNQILNKLTGDSLAASRFADIVRKISTFLPLLLLVVAIFMVRHLLRSYTLSEVILDIKAVPPLNIVCALLLSILNYLVLTLYDYLGSLYVRAKIPIRKVALASFVAYAFSQNLGASVLSGGAVRYRFYQREGLSGSSIARLIGFTVFHFWLGLFFLAGTLAIIIPESFSELFHVSILLCRACGILVLMPSGVYVFFLFFPSVLARKYRRLIPRTSIGLFGIFVCVFDWFLAASVFYCLLYGEHNITLFRTIAAFIAAQVAGVMSHVPGGLGVFEATVAFLLAPHHDKAHLVTTLIIFRLIYYFFPFLISVVLMTIYEVGIQYKNISRNREAWVKFQFLESLFLASSPVINSMLCLISGFSLLSSSVLPSDVSFPQIGRSLIPLSVFEASHFLSSIFGVVLIFIGVGLRRRIKQTWYVMFSLLSFALLLSIGKDHNFETAYLVLTLSFLYFTRNSFYRAGSFITSQGSARWAWSIGAVVFCLLLGFFSFEEIDYSHELWWTFGVEHDAPRFLRSIFGMLLGLVGCGSYFAFSKSKNHVPSFPKEEDLNLVKDILSKQGATVGYLSLTEDKELLFSEKKDSFLMWRVSGSSIVCFGDPQGDPETFQELSWKFRELAEEFSKFCAFYEISPAMIPFVLDLGLRVFKIGEEGVVDLNKFSLHGSKAAKLRNAISKMKKEGISFSVLEKEDVKRRIGELKAISDEWLLSKNVAEKGFSLGFFEEEYVSNFRCGIAEQDGKILGFANVLESLPKRELSIDLMRQTEASPHGVMDFLFTNLFLWGKDNKYESFSLGMAPLSGLANNPLAPNYAKIGNMVFRHGGHFYNFEGLRKYKEKFEPDWIPRYVACSNGLFLPIILSNISVLISGGVKGLVRK